MRDVETKVLQRNSGKAPGLLRTSGRRRSLPAESRLRLPRSRQGQVACALFANICHSSSGQSRVVRACVRALLDLPHTATAAPIAQTYRKRPHSPAAAAAAKRRFMWRPVMKRFTLTDRRLDRSADASRHAGSIVLCNGNAILRNLNAAGTRRFARTTGVVRRHARRTRRAGRPTIWNNSLLIEKRPPVAVGACAPAAAEGEDLVRLRMATPDRASKTKP